MKRIYPSWPSTRGESGLVFEIDDDNKWTNNSYIHDILRIFNKLVKAKTWPYARGRNAEGKERTLKACGPYFICDCCKLAKVEFEEKHSMYRSGGLGGKNYCWRCASREGNGPAYRAYQRMLNGKKDDQIAVEKAEAEKKPVPIQSVLTFGRE